jgi:hypothetical protein
MAPDNAEIWLTVGPAGDAAGVARRTAFRWVALRLLTIREVSGRRCIEVGALRRLALARHNAKGMAPNAASPDPSDETVAAPHPAPEQEALLALSESMANVEELLAGLVLRLDGIERTLGLR